MFVNGVPIGMAIRLRRVELGWTQKQLARCAGLSPSKLSRIETGHVWPLASTLAKIITALGGKWEIYYDAKP